ncbi:hypothetical protein OIU79_021012 [Salix purpurea]|uniref:Uncharacterized protein n=1 Tax=Salix purpurea TaxID=77065 RepID=A0A9Q1AGI8_SALPP|nr:hypothetical protein OIU79_021012 [Salix purpurea]
MGEQTFLVNSVALGSIQPADPMFAEVEAAAGGWEQVRKKHRSNKRSRKKHYGAAAEASAGLVLLAEKSKSVADLNGLNSELDVGLAAGIASESAGNSLFPLHLLMLSRDFVHLLQLLSA